jgi:stress response protein SCP2
MQPLIFGQKIKLSDLSSNNQLQVGLSISSLNNLNLEISCFGVDDNNKLSDDRYFIFFNQKTSPCGSLSSLGARNGDQEQFHIDLSRLPSIIRKLVFVVTIDGNGVMSQIRDGYLRLLDKTTELTRFTFSGSDFKDEKAIMVGEIYFKDVWRFSAVGQGFNGGLSAVLKYFGGQEIIEPALSESQPKKTSQTQLSKSVLLEKKLEKEAPQLLNLAKKLSVSLEKKQLQDTIARVAIVMDASGSMSLSYKNGSVQSVLDRIALVAARLDDDGNLETWFYASKHKKFPDISIENVVGYLKKYVKSGFMSIVNGLGVGNNEPPIMQEILSAYKSSSLPTLIIFITDGGVYETDKIKQILIEASNYPIFWQFVGLKGSNYGVLGELDNMRGRIVDNAGFFAVDDLEKIKDEDLYDRLLSEFPGWLKEARKNGIIN